MIFTSPSMHSNGRYRVVACQAIGGLVLGHQSPVGMIMALGSWLTDKVSNPSLFTMLSTQCASHPRNVTATALAPGPRWPGAGGATAVV